MHSCIFRAKIHKLKIVLSRNIRANRSRFNLITLEQIVHFVIFIDVDRFLSAFGKSIKKKRENKNVLYIYIYIRVWRGEP